MRNILKYRWAVNEVKLDRAVNELEAEAKLDSKVKVTEEAIRERYLKYAGKVKEVEEAEEVAEKPKRSKKK